MPSSAHVGQVSLVREALQQLGTLLGAREAGRRQAKRAGELGRRLVVRAEPRRPLARGRRELENGVDVPGGLGVMGDPGQVGARRGGPASAGAPAVKLVAAVGRHGLLDGDALDLVPECDPVAVDAEHPRRQAVLDEGQLVGGDLLEQPHLGARRRDGDGVE